jgi:two-component system response regulator AgrA
MKKIYIIEDNINYSKFLKESILMVPSALNWIIQPNINYIDFFENVSSYTIETESIFFLDIDLHTYFNGVELAKKILEHFPFIYIVFLTNYEDHSIDVINQQISPKRYLLKTLDQSHFVSELSDFFDSVNNEIIKKADQQILLTAGASVLSLNSSEIDYISSAHSNQRRQLFIQMVDRTYWHSGTIKKISPLFSSLSFTLNLKSYLINLNNISEIHSTDLTVRFRSGNELVLGTKILNKVRHSMQLL